ncbi:MAG TPA: hypothetical protein GXX18_07260 [Bacillales bacterium]|nr:hypothetical protein [Bacillales bacterium]
MRAQFDLGDIQVTTIESSSGIFISQTNIVNGWRSQIKLNSGLGKVGNQNKFEKMISIVSDDDNVDSPMVNNSMWIENNIKNSESNIDINFNEIKVDLLDTNATISIGENTQSGWASQIKGNLGNGQFIGDNVLADSLNVVKDDDIVDAPVQQRLINFSPNTEIG